MNLRTQYLLKSILYAILLNRHKMMAYKQKYHMFDNNTIIVPNGARKTLNISVIGKNNKIIIPDSVGGSIAISVFGDNNNICFGDNIYAGTLDIVIGQNHANFGPVHDCNIQIGDGCSFESTQIVIKNSFAKISIGKNCMFAFNITLYHTDSHPIFDLDSGKIINKVKEMNIGDHVWIGANATILKNTFIADDCIVGWGGVVTGRFPEEHAVLAGNPAKIVKNNITWDYNGSKGYVQNERD